MTETLSQPQPNAHPVPERGGCDIRPYVAAFAEGRHPAANGANRNGHDGNPEASSEASCLAQLMAAQQSAEGGGQDAQLIDPSATRYERLAAALDKMQRRRGTQDPAPNPGYARQAEIDWLRGVVPEPDELLGFFEQVRLNTGLDPDESDTAARVKIGEIAEAGRTLRITGEQQQVPALPSSPWFWPRRWFGRGDGHNGAAAGQPAIETQDSRQRPDLSPVNDPASGRPPARPKHSMDGPTMLVQQVTRPNPALTGETVVIPTVPAAATAPNATPAAPEAPIQKPAAQPEATTPQAFTIPGVEGFAATDVIYIGGRPVTQWHLQFLLPNTTYNQLLIRIQEYRTLPADRKHERPGLVQRINWAVQQLNGQMHQAENDPSSLQRRPVIDHMVARDRSDLAPGELDPGVQRRTLYGADPGEVDDFLARVVASANRNI